MLLAVTFLIANAHQGATITLPSAFYSVRELATALTKQGVQVEAGSDVAADVYAVRIDHMDWNGLKNALVQDGRLTINWTGTRWSIHRESSNKVADRRRYEAYIGQLAATVRNIYGSAATICLALSKLPQEAREAVYEKNKLGLSPQASKLVSLYSNVHDIAWPTIGVPWQLSLGNGPLPTRPTVVELTRARQALFEDGNLRGLTSLRMVPANATDAELTTIAQNIRVAGKFAVDPISLQTAWAFAIDVSSVFPNVRATLRRERIALDDSMVKPELLWKSSALKDLRKRAETPMTEAGDDQPMPNRAMLAAEAMLRWATGSHKNLVAYASPMADASLEPKTERSLQGILEDANQGRIDASSAHLDIVERVDATSNDFPKPALRAIPRYSVARMEDIFVVRNEWAMLDQACGGPSAVTASDLNSLLTESPPSVRQLAAEVSRLNFPAWSNGVFAERDLTFCNPISFRPFALAYLASPAIAKAVSSLKSGASVELSLNDIGEQAARQLADGLAESAPLNDAVADPLVDPMTAALVWTGIAPEFRLLRLERSVDRLTVTLTDRASIMWSTWIRGVKF